MITRSPHHFVLCHTCLMNEKNCEQMILLLPYVILSSIGDKTNHL